MLELIIGFILGYWVACNQEEVKDYFNKFVEWIKEQKNKKSQE